MGVSQNGSFFLWSLIFNQSRGWPLIRFGTGSIFLTKLFAILEPQNRLKPDRPFHDLGASKTAAQRFFLDCDSEKSNDFETKS